MAKLRVTVIGGIPGAGKTTYRKEHYLDLPYFDMDELRKEVDPNIHGSYDRWHASMHSLFNGLFNALEQGVEHVIVEGIFEHNSKSLQWLYDYCHDFEITVEYMWIDAEFAVVLERLVEDYKHDLDEERLVSRTYLAAKYAGGFK